MNKQAVIDARHEAISDCKYAKSLGHTALMQHIAIWTTLIDEDNIGDNEYHATITEIEYKLGTPECLLEN